jgi:hypothetical protein
MVYEMKTGFHLPPPWYFCNIDAAKIKIETGKENGFIVYINIQKNAASINFRQNADSGNNEAVKPLSSSRSHYNFKF